MAIYFVTFIFSYFFCLIGEKLTNKGNRKNAIFMFSLAAIIPSILAGIRDYTIGTDIATYGHWLFLGAKSSTNLIDFAISNPSIEFLYSVLVYVTAHLFQTEHWLYFFTGVIVYGFTIGAFYRYRNYISISIAWVSYLFLFYGDTLNAMRQSIAMAIFIYAFSYFQTRERIKFVILIALAFLFHTTSIIIVGFVGIYLLLERRNNLKTRATIIVGAIVLMLGYAKIIDVAVNIGLFDAKYLKYSNQIVTGFSLNPIVIRLPFLIFIMLFYSRFINNKSYKIKKSFGDFIILMIILEMLTAEMRMINISLYRISLYFGMYRCVGLGRLIKSLKLKNNRMVITGLICLLLIVMWIYQNVIQGNNQIYPFTSELIGI